MIQTIPEYLQRFQMTSKDFKWPQKTQMERIKLFLKSKNKKNLRGCDRNDNPTQGSIFIGQDFSSS